MGSSVESLTVLYIFYRHSGLDPESIPLIFLDSRRSLPPNVVIGGGRNDGTCKLISKTPH